MGPGHSHYLQALELSREVREFIDCFLPALPGIHECKFLYLNYVFTCWDLAAQNHNCMLETYFSFWLWLAFSDGLQIANLLNCTSWSGVGLGLMHTATKGALEVGKSVGGLKIGKEADEGTASNFHLCLPSETYLTCR